MSYNSDNEIPPYERKYLQRGVLGQEIGSRTSLSEQIEMFQTMLIIQGKNHEIEIEELRYKYEKKIHDLKFEKLQLEKVLWEKKDASPWYYLSMFFRRFYFETRDKISRKHRPPLSKKTPKNFL